MVDTDAPASSYLPNLGVLFAERRLTRLAVSLHLEYDQAQVSRWATGQRRVPGNVLPRLAKLLGLSVADLLIQGSDGWTPPEPHARPDIQAEATQPVAKPPTPPEPPRHREPVRFGTIDPTPMGRSPARLCWGCPVHPKGLVR